MKEHFKNHELLISEINKAEIYVILAPSNVYCFNKAMKNWPEDFVKKNQLAGFEKGNRLTLCLNEIPKNMENETVKNIILNCNLHPENIHRLQGNNGNPKTLVLFKLKNESEEHHAKRYGKRVDNKS